MTDRQNAKHLRSEVLKVDDDMTIRGKNRGGGVEYILRGRVAYRTDKDSVFNCQNGQIEEPPPLRK